MWEPIALIDLKRLISEGGLNLNDQQMNFWNAIKIEPEKWEEEEYGVEGGGFWVVAILGNEVIWYNDIEEGFNISTYNKYGYIDVYQCNQSELHREVIGLMNRKL